MRIDARRPRRAAVVLLALAACAHAAQAQSSVTLYGAIDTSLEITNPGSSWTPRLDSGAYRGSRLGLRGSETLGAGTKLLFTLENGFASDTGALATTGVLFNRQAWLGLGAPWGELRVGRQYSPIYIPFKGQLDAFGAGTIASGLNNLSKITPYTDNAIAWLSPELRGFSMTWMVATRDSGEGNGFDGHYETFAYRDGPLRLSYARQQTHGSDGLRANLGGVSYQFGRTTAFVSAFNGDGGSPSYHAQGLSISARHAATARVRASLGYTFLRDRSGGHDDADQLSAACEFDLSRRVLLYAGAALLRNRGDAEFTLRGVNVTGLTPDRPGAPVRGVQFGVVDRF